MLHHELPEAEEGTCLQDASEVFPGVIESIPEWCRQSPMPTLQEQVNTVA